MKRFLALLLVIILVAAAFAGCGKEGGTNTNPNTSVSTNNDVPGYMNATGYPIAKDKITLKMMGTKSPVQGEWKDMEVMKRMENITNISFNYDTPLSEGYQERKNLAFASGDLPDVFYLGGISITDEETYGPQGLLLPLENYIDKYAPTLKKRMEAEPALKKAVTASDGHIYSLPSVVRTKTVAANIIYVNTEWLGNVGMKKPETVDEFYNVLKAFKEKDPNKNGKADEIPLSYWKQTPNQGTIGGILNAVFLSAFSGQAGGANYDLRNGKVVYNPAESYFKDFLTYMHKLYAEGLLDPEVFTQSMQQYVAKYQSGIMGLSTISLSSILKPTDKAPYELLSPLTSAQNNKKVVEERTGLTTGSFVLTKNCKYPEAMLRWVDIFYKDVDENVEGICGLSNFLGVYKFNWDFTDNTRTKYTRESKVEGVTPVDYINKYVMPGSSCWVVTDAVPDTDPLLLIKAVESQKQYFPYTIPIFPNTVRYTQAETDRITLLQNDITTYVDQMIAKFITGEESLDKWDTYISKLKQMNVDELTKIKQTAYDRWNKAQ